jgi:trafficking protein particle complex subunit 9
MPSPLASGHLYLSYTTHPLPSSHQSLSLFRPADFPLGVVGIASSSQNDSLSATLAQFNAMLTDLFPPGALFPLANNCLVFEESDGSTNLNLGNHPGLVVIPAMMGNKRLYVGTLIADLCSNILAEFATVVSFATPVRLVHITTLNKGDRCNC